MSTLCAYAMVPPPGLMPTQADKLPEFDESAIPNIKRLSNVGGLYIWGNCIQISLGKRRLADLTSDTMSRPGKDHPKYDNWAKWSRFVSKWLIENVDEHYASVLKASQPALEFAVTTYRAIQQLEISMTLDEDCLATHLFSLWDLCRPQFRGVDDYVEAFHEQVIRCQTLILYFNYVSATMIMLHEMEVDMPVLAKFISEQVEHDYIGHEQMTYYKFKSIVRGIIGTVQNVESQVSL